MNTDWEILASYTGLLTLASSTIYVGSFGSLPDTKRRTAESQKTAEGEDEEDGDEVIERLTSSDAWLFPILGSVVLFGLYLIVKYFGTEWINFILQCYTSITGVGSVWKTSTALTKFIVGPERWRKYKKHRIITIKQSDTGSWSMSCRTPTLCLLGLSAVPSLVYTFTRFGRQSAMLSNILALSFCYSGLAFIKLDSFVTGCVLLSGLFVYDVWWVFGTDVVNDLKLTRLREFLLMGITFTLATTLDVPIKLLWPKSMWFSPANGYTMLGLGDVVVPGIFVALGLRYDYERSRVEAMAGARTYRKPYFYGILAGYVFGLATTMGVMHVFKRGQPALLYISPACIVAFLVTGVVRGEMGMAWGWVDDPEREQGGGATGDGGSRTKGE